jgi:hypothetical protein
MLGGRYLRRNQTSRGMSRPRGIMRSPRPSTFRPRRSQTILDNSASRLSLRCWCRRAGPTASAGCHYRSAEAGPALTLLRYPPEGRATKSAIPFSQLLSEPDTNSRRSTLAKTARSTANSKPRLASSCGAQEIQAVAFKFYWLAAKRPNSTSRVLPSCRLNPNFANRVGRSISICCASAWCSKSSR